MDDAGSVREQPGADEPSDEALMASWCGGERRAFEALFNRYAGRLHGYFLRSVGAEEHARDLVQQTFLHLHRARADFRQGSPLRPWLYTIAANLKRQHFRTRSRKPEAAWDVERHGEPAVAPGVSTPRQRLVRRSLEALPDNQREVVTLHYYEGLSFTEIAAVLGISVSAAKVRAHRAYGRLRDILGEGK